MYPTIVYFCSVSSGHTVVLSCVDMSCFQSWRVCVYLNCVLKKKICRVDLEQWLQLYTVNNMWRLRILFSFQKYYDSSNMRRLPLLYVFIKSICIWPKIDAQPNSSRTNIIPTWPSWPLYLYSIMYQRRWYIIARKWVR